jgi:uncharacterized SAM-binding protein YcdF (DUF218 family)
MFTDTIFFMQNQPDQQILLAAKVIWDYLRIGMSLQKSDGMLIFCSNDLRVADYAADLYHQGYAPWICPSGGTGRLTYDLYHKPEAEAFADVLRKHLVPDISILIENQATNTAENIFFTQQVLKNHHKNPESLLVLQKPYMERRTLAALQQYWPEMKVITSSPPIPFEKYPFPGFLMEDLIHVLVGDFQRIQLYAERGWQAPQEIPPEVWEAYHVLIQNGYTKQLANPSSPPVFPPKTD